ncbi:hypothetical protein MMC29_001516 [Sticta canariensis]|nr:hypothetical protein [Sticta canariensis]
MPCSASQGSFAGVACRLLGLCFTQACMQQGLLPPPSYAGIHGREADDEQKGRQSDDYDQLEVPFLKEMRKPGKKGKKQGGEQHDEENPPRRRQQQAEQESAPHSGQHAQSRPLTSPFAQPPPGQQQPPEESAADQPGTVQHPPGHAHTILAPPLVPPGPSTDAKRQAEARMLTRAISGLFSDPERRQEAAQDAAIGSMGEGEGEEDDEEERLFNQQELADPADQMRGTMALRTAAGSAFLLREQSAAHLQHPPAACHAKHLPGHPEHVQLSMRRAGGAETPDDGGGEAAAGGGAEALLPWQARGGPAVSQGHAAAGLGVRRADGPGWAAPQPLVPDRKVGHPLAACPHCPVINAVACWA